uniref:Uncharacterized protein LOC111110305 n=1 Tax=Crassostrea virginica TaxID=6565 RepID=A0A8B8BI05_CRAVI|nr:uncharacterized protein LOC111110305 [Crassostrea virginica]
MSAYNCSDPNSVSNGYYVIDKSYYEDGDQVFFICFSTYSLNGNPTLKCDGSTGSWPGTYPTCTSSSTTTTAAPEYEEWLYVGIGTISFLGLLLLLLLIVLFIKVCLRICSKSSRVRSLRGTDNWTEVGCCYYSCTRCCVNCWSCCQDNTDVIKVNDYKQNQKEIKNIPKSNYTVSTQNTVSLISGETTPSLVRKGMMPAKELNSWMPHSHNVRNNNTSTR